VKRLLRLLTKDKGGFTFVELMAGDPGGRPRTARRGLLSAAGPRDRRPPLGVGAVLRPRLLRGGRRESPKMFSRCRPTT
jgi:hypothetical protein